MKRLTFACELPTDELHTLFTDPAVLEHLIALQARVSLGLIDLSAGRAAVVRRLNAAGVPVIAWLLLPREQGYWFNAGNAPQAAARYDAFRDWTAEHGLDWERVGVDVEPDMAEMQGLLGRDRWRLLPRLLARALNEERVRAAQMSYAALVARMRADGYPVESYQLPFIVDERRAGSTLLQRTLGLVDLQADREVLMLYTSFMGSAGPAVLWSYAPDAGGVGVGITGDGVEPEGVAKVMSWEEFARDLRLAGRRGEEILVFSLEGCVQQGFLPRLQGFDWERPNAIPEGGARMVSRVRRVVRGLLWGSAHPTLVLAGLLGLVALLRRPRSRPARP